MSSNTYNGWTNYETWVTHLWLTNEESGSLYWEEQADEVWQETADEDNDDDTSRVQTATDELAERLKNDITEATPETTGLFADLLNAALSEVNWSEIAEAFIDTVSESV